MQFMDLIGFRLIASFCSGTLLCLAGSLMQMSLANDLAGPSTIGLEAFIVLVIIAVNFLWQSFAFSFGQEILSLLLITLVTLILWSMKGRWKSLVQSEQLIVLGLCFNLFVGALFSFLQFISQALNREFPGQIWYGNFRFVEPYQAFLLVMVTLLCFFYIRRHSAKTLLLGFGPSIHLNLKIDAANFVQNSCLLAFFITGIVSVFFGVFSFVTLLFPHLIRKLPWVKRDPQKEFLLGPIIAGALFMTFDYICRENLFFFAEIPVGMVTGMIGSFWLILALIKSNFLKNRSRS